MTQDTEATLMRNRRLLAEDRFGRMDTPTPEGVARSQRLATETTLTPQTIGKVLGTEVAQTDEEVSPVGVKVERYIEVGDRPNNDSGVKENAGSSPLGMTDVKSGFDVIIPGTPHTDPDGDMMD